MIPVSDILSTTIKALLLLGCFCLWNARAGESFELKSVAPGVYMHPGTIGDFSPSNEGDIANLGAVVGERCIAVIDTGGSYRVGQKFLAKIRSLSDLPICYVIATHMHPDHLLGHGAFVGEKPEFIAADTQTRALLARQVGYLARQKQVLGEAAEGTEVVLPTRGVKGELTLDLGGRTLLVKAWRTAHTDNDLTVQDSVSGVIFFGDLLFCRHLPVIDGSLRGWLAVIPRLKEAMDHHLGIPGHGPLQEGVGGLEDEERYLSGIAREVRAALKARKTLAVTVAASEMPLGWELVELYHKRNITAAYAELEWEDD